METVYKWKNNYWMKEKIVTKEVIAYYEQYPNLQHYFQKSFDAGALQSVYISKMLTVFQMRSEIDL